MFIRCLKCNILKEIHKEYITFQIAKTLKFLHFNNILHRDIKPSNILINEECFIKICDFGSATYLFTKNIENVENIYVASRWYKAPESLLDSNYTDKSELWSLGCLIAELYLKKPLFQGTSNIHQLELIISIMGVPTSGELESMGISQNNSLFELISMKKTSSLNDQFFNIPEKPLDLIKKLWVYNPKKRISLDEILKHKYVNQFFNFWYKSRNMKNLEMELINDYLNKNFDNFEQIINHIFNERIYIKKKHLIKNFFSFKEDSKSENTIN